MTFAFSLDAVLQQRVRQEQGAQLTLARAITVHTSAVAQLEAMVHERLRLERGAAASNEVVDPEAHMTTLYYLDRCARLLQQQRGIVASHEQEVQQARALLVAASQRRRVLEKLRERRESEFQARYQKHLDNQLDELVTLRYDSAARGLHA